MSEITGDDLLQMAASKTGQRYVYGATVPKDREWNGPWDCAEFVSHVVKIKTGQLLGVISENNPDAYTGAWKNDVDKKKVIPISVESAINIPGAILLRRRGKYGHIAFSDGKGGTIEAMSSARGVTRGNAYGRSWTNGILLYDVKYSKKNASLTYRQP